MCFQLLYHLKSKETQIEETKTSRRYRAGGISHPNHSSPHPNGLVQNFSPSAPRHPHDRIADCYVHHCKVDVGCIDLSLVSKSCCPACWCGSSWDTHISTSTSTAISTQQPPHIPQNQRPCGVDTCFSFSRLRFFHKFPFFAVTFRVVCPRFYYYVFK